MLLRYAATATATACAEPQRVVVAGDSTAAEYGPERAPRAGWGQAGAAPFRRAIRRLDRRPARFVAARWRGGAAAP
ncbi:hypothetical protein Y886_16355 [Xanthomonas hyacinthi DSM 19077]|nr:hypothetical protein Y886_16355 [Xanthomonas hyacinthi DSM 19077]